MEADGLTSARREATYVIFSPRNITPGRVDGTRLRATFPGVAVAAAAR